MVSVATKMDSHLPCPPDRSEPPLILHVLPTFAVGGVQVRTAEIINHLGESYRNAIVALDGKYACEGRLTDKARVDFPSVAIEQKRTVGAVKEARSQLRKIHPALLLTYNWGAIEWAFANALGPNRPHVHFEDGFGLEEADRQLTRRVYFRRIALARTAHIVVPSETLLQLATQSWKLPQDKIILIPNGVDCSKFVRSPEESTELAFRKSENELVVGTVAPLRPEKNLGFLLEAFAATTSQFDAKLVIVGDGPVRADLEQHAQALGIADRVNFTGHVEAVEKVLACFDVFAVTSRTEQMPISVLQAMAAAKPVATVDVGDVKLMLSPQNRPFVVPKDDEFAFREALAGLLKDAPARARIGAQNRAHVQKHYPQDRMLEAYRKLFEASIEHVKPHEATMLSMGQ